MQSLNFDSYVDVAFIKALSEAGVKSFEGNGVKIKFHYQGHKVDGPSPTVNDSHSSLNSQFADTRPTEKKTTEVPFNAGLAQVMEAEMNPDKLLHWSSSPDPQELQQETPLTGDAPLTEG